jgi:retron-type reverse transcriptase
MLSHATQGSDDGIDGPLRIGVLTVARCGRQRPLAVAALEDKIVQRAMATVLNAIYEEDFLALSHGFRRGEERVTLCVGIHSKKVSYIRDADIRSFVDEINQQWFPLPGASDRRPAHHPPDLRMA